MNSPINKQAAYWSDRMSRAFGPAGSGMEAYGNAFNWWLYQVAKIRFRRTVTKLGLALHDSHILDVGCGTGFYLREWKLLGAERLTGVDIAQTAISRLADRFPDCSLLQADIGQSENPLPANRFLAVSAFAVLFHIVDDIRYRSALENIHASLLPGGYFIFSENFVHAARPPMGDYHVCRTLESIQRALADAGFTVVDRVPLFVLLGDPVDSDSRWLHIYWRALSWLVMRSHAAGGILGCALFPLELALTALVRDSPTTEIMICRKVS